MEQEHHGKLMFVVLGLVLVVVIILGIVVVFGRGSQPVVGPPEPTVSTPKSFDEATAAQNGDSFFTDEEIEKFNQATRAK